ncbi:MAG: hypothetical protein QXU67_01915 [Candidatus Bathyarchaeia archaeon]
MREKSAIELSGGTFHVSFTPTAHEKMISSVYVTVNFSGGFPSGLKRIVGGALLLSGAAPHNRAPSRFA